MKKRSSWNKGAKVSTKTLSVSYRKSLSSKQPNPSGFCQCGCGKKTNIAPYSDKEGNIIGQPLRYLIGHGMRGRHVSKETLQRMHYGQLGEKGSNWKGDNVQPFAGHARAKRKFKLWLCEICGTKAHDRHHKDGNPLNNDPSNVQRLCRRCHQTVDGRMKRLKTWSKNWSGKRGRKRHE